MHLQSLAHCPEKEFVRPTHEELVWQDCHQHHHLTHAHHRGCVPDADGLCRHDQQPYQKEQQKKQGSQPLSGPEGISAGGENERLHHHETDECHHVACVGQEPLAKVGGASQPESHLICAEEQQGRQQHLAKGKQGLLAFLSEGLDVEAVRHSLKEQKGERERSALVSIFH